MDVSILQASIFLGEILIYTCIYIYTGLYILSQFRRNLNVYSSYPASTVIITRTNKNIIWCEIFLIMKSYVNFVMDIKLQMNIIIYYRM